VVIANAPLLRDGTPMPTRYWLIDPQLREAVSTLESTGGVRAAEASVDPEELAEAHRRYATERDALMSPAHIGPDLGRCRGTQQESSASMRTSLGGLPAERTQWEIGSRDSWELRSQWSRLLIRAPCSSRLRPPSSERTRHHSAALPHKRDSGPLQRLPSVPARPYERESRSRLVAWALFRAGLEADFGNPVPTDLR